MNKDNSLIRMPRPVNLNLRYFHFPLPALLSITHRITGIILFFSLIFLLWAFDQSLTDAATFTKIQQLFKESFLSRWVLWFFLSVLTVHFLAGIRHLLLDIHIADSQRGGQISAMIAVAFCLLAMILLGVWLW